MSIKLFLVGSLIFLLGGSISASDDVMGPIDVTRLILRKNPSQNYILPRAESTSTVSPNPYSDCGVANDATTKIIGGNETAPNEFPWMAVLLVDKIINGTSSSSFCGGSLIADRWILTSASCLAMSDKQVSKVVNVYLGGHNISAPSEVNRKEYWGNETFIHPEWNRTTQAGDVALLKLSTVVKYTKYIRPICLPSSSEPNYVNQTVTVTGVGLTPVGGDSPSLVIHKMPVSVVTNSECNATYINLMNDRMMCTKTAITSSGICEMDKGNPLMFRQTSGVYKQIAIVSFAPIASCQMNVPYGYTKLSSYSSWISQKITPPTPSTTPSPTTTASATSGTSSALLPLVSFLIFAMKMALY